ncbi:MAG: response regulator transcription factor [Solirubrobacteraceae bacterium]|nr:MAG: DNA-binding response regulator [Solirubrobacterales bacterium]
MRVLIVEDNVKLAALVRRALRNDGLQAEVAINGEDALWMAAASEYDVILLDVMLPGIDGFETCRLLRDRDIRTPVLMLTARDAITDRVAGLDGGADDYLTKPFSPAELAARVRALSRRGPVERLPVLSVGELRLAQSSRRVWRDDEEIALTSKEFTLLEIFMRRPGEVVSRVALLDQGWDDAYDNRSNVVDVFISSLRKKIDEPFKLTSLETVRGSGYRLRADGGAPVKRTRRTRRRSRS